MVKIAKNCQNRLKSSKMVQNGLKLSKMIQNGLKWLKVVKNGQFGPKWSKIVKNVQNWSKIVQNGKNGKGLQLEAGARRAPRLLVAYISVFLSKYLIGYGTPISEQFLCIHTRRTLVVMLCPIQMDHWFSLQDQDQNYDGDIDNDVSIPPLQ